MLFKIILFHGDNDWFTTYDTGQQNFIFVKFSNSNSNV